MSDPRLFKTRSEFSALKWNFLQESQLYSSLCLGPFSSTSHPIPHQSYGHTGWRETSDLLLSPNLSSSKSLAQNPSHIYQKKKNAILCSWIAGNEHAAKITGTIQLHPRRQPALVRGSALQTGGCAAQDCIVAFGKATNDGLSKVISQSSSSEE